MSLPISKQRSVFFKKLLANPDIPIFEYFSKGFHSIEEINETIINQILKINSEHKIQYTYEYTRAFNETKWNANSGNIPEKLYKYYDFDGGYKALTSMIKEGLSTIKFSDANIFKIPGNLLSDKTEVDHGRFYIDILSMEQLKSVKTNFKGIDREFILNYLNHYVNTYDKNKVCCFSKSNNNAYLWGANDHQICIEYNSELFKGRFFNAMDKIELIYNHVHYVDKIIKIPYRYDSFEWLTNLFFIKSIEYSKEDEFRILWHTNDNNPYRKLNSGANNSLYRELTEADRTQFASVFPQFDISFINKIYLKEGKNCLLDLIAILKDYDLEYELI